METLVIDGLAGQWIAGDPLPSSAPIAPYPTAPTGGYSVPARPPSRPIVGAPTPNLDDVINSQTYTTPTGARAWLPTNYDNELIDTVTRNPYHGMDELLEAAGDRAVANAAGRGAKYLPYVGDVAGGAVEAAAVYGRTGSLTHATLAGGGATIGGIAGTAIGGAIGAVGGPLGIAIGGIVGGAIGGALGSALGQGLANFIDPLYPVNKNGATFENGLLPFDAALPVNYSSVGGVRIRAYSYNNNGWYEFDVRAVTGAFDETYTYNWGSITYTSLGFTNCQGNRSSVPTIKATYQDSSGSGFYLGWGPAQPVSIVAHGVCSAPSQPFNEEDFRQPKLDPIKPTLPIPRIPQIPGIKLPSPDFPNLPNFPGLPKGWPTGTQPPPAPNPHPQPTPLPNPNPAPGPGPNPAPGPNPGPDPDPTGTDDPIGDSGQCDPCIELKAIRAKLEETFSLAWALPDCGTDFNITRTGEKEGQGLAGLSQKIDGLYQVLRVLHDNTRCDSDSFVVVPDSWPMKVEAGRPQLVLIYATKNKDKTWGSRRYEFCIPHFDGKLRKALKTLVPKEIKKGSHQGTYTLADNSKIITYCKTKTEAMRIINAFDKLVLKDQKTTNKKTGEINPKNKFLELTLYPFEARFFSQGQQNPNPDWKDKLF